MTNKDKTFDIGELCVVPYHNKNGFNHSYGIVVRRNPLKLRRNFYTVFYDGKVKESAPLHKSHNDYGFEEPIHYFPFEIELKV